MNCQVSLRVLIQVNIFSSSDSESLCSGLDLLLVEAWVSPAPLVQKAESRIR
jgi:hypothetical protein